MDLARWAQTWKLPVVSDWRAQDMLDHDSSSWCGFLGYGGSPFAAELLKNADAVLFLGCVNADVPSSGYSPGANGRWVGIAGSDPDLLGHDGNVDAQVLMGIDGFARAAVANVAPCVRSRWEERTADARANECQFSQAAPDTPAWGVDLGAVMAQTDRWLPNDSIVTYGARNHALWAQRCLHHHRPGTLVTPATEPWASGFPRQSPPH